MWVLLFDSMKCRFEQSALVLLAWLLLPAVAVATPHIYHSPADDGIEAPLVPGISLGTQVVHLYIDSGAVPSSAGTACHAGSGEEVCGWVIDIGVSGGIAIQSFTAAPGQDIAWNLLPTAWRGTGGNFEVGELGPVKIGDLTVAISDTGYVSAGASETVNASLAKDSIPDHVIALPEPDGRWMLLIGGAFLAAADRCRKRR